MICPPPPQKRCRAWRRRKGESIYVGEISQVRNKTGKYMISKSTNRFFISPKDTNAQLKVVTITKLASTKSRRLKLYQACSLDLMT